MAAEMDRCTATGTPSPAAAPPISAPRTAPTLQIAWNEFRIERPYRRCTRSPCEFCATSATESIAPSRNSAAANHAQDCATPASSAQRLAAIMPETATRAERKRRINKPANNPELSAPIGPAAMAKPNSAFDSPSPDLMDGNSGTRLAGTAPLVRKSKATAMRARRFSCCIATTVTHSR